jgi:hypothetical protein
MNWNTMIRAAKPRKRMRSRELPLAAPPSAARAGATQPSVTNIVVIRVLMASSLYYRSVICSVCLSECSGCATTNKIFACYANQLKYLMSYFPGLGRASFPGEKNP